MDILCDVDGVLANMHIPWLEDYNRDYDDDLTVEAITSWHIHHFVKPECGEKIYDYLAHPDLYSRSPVYPGALEGIEALRSAGHKVIFVTSGFFPAKMQWLMDNGFSSARKVCFPVDTIVTTDKGRISGDVMIDDCPFNFGGRKWKIVFDQPWNRNMPMDDRTLRVNGWKDMNIIIGQISMKERT
jgi:5'-nucleotidase